MIVYFVYAARRYKKILIDEGVRVLVSYGIVRRMNLGKLLGGFESIIVDSGGYQIQTEDRRVDRVREQVTDLEEAGFSEWEVDRMLKLDTKGLPTIDGYILWLYGVTRNYRLDGYFNLDILGDGKKNMENQLYMESNGLKPIPVWHDGEDIRYLSNYCEKYELVAIGGLKNIYSPAYYVKLFTWLKQRYPDQKFHLFSIGLYALSCLYLLEPYSVDLSTWVTPARFGHLIVIKNGRLTEIKPDDETREKFRNSEYVWKVLTDTVRALKQLEYVSPKDYGQLLLLDDMLLSDKEEFITEVATEERHQAEEITQAKWKEAFG